MIINKFKIQNFKKFKDLSLEFQAGINVVHGLNEAGKSTVSHALLEVLFGDPSTQAKRHLAEIYPWNGAKNVYLELDFEANGNKFQLIKDFGTKSALLRNLNTDKMLDRVKEVNVAIAKLLGIASRNVYESTAFVRQSDLAVINTNDDFISALHRVVLSSGTNVNVQDVIRELEQELKQLRVGLDRPAKNPGQLKILTDQLKDLEQELNEKQTLWSKVKQAAALVKSSKNELSSIEKRINEIETLLKNNKILKEATRKINELDVKIMKLEDKLHNIKDIETGEVDLVEIEG